MRDLDGYVGPGGERQTRWAPSRVEVWPSASVGDCECPCLIAHPTVTQGACDGTAPIAARAITHEDFNSFFPVALCAVCAAAQLSRMDKGRWEPTVPASEIRHGELFELGALILAVAMTWWFTSVEIALALAVGLGVGRSLSVRNRR